MLLRRLYLDLTGLPPAPEEVEALPGKAAKKPMFASWIAFWPLLRGKVGARWLDIARYATNGYEKDRPRSMWPTATGDSQSQR